jgi:hypothetical protein
MDKLEQLRQPFKESEIEWRVQASGKAKDGKIWARVLAYVDARALRKRLNDVLGPLNWEPSYSTVGHGTCCTLHIRIGGKCYSKSDGAGETQIEGVKGGFSDAFKRACYTWGIGEYLYDLDADFAEIVPKSKNWGKLKDGTVFYWNPPKLPAWALPKGTRHEHAKPATPVGNNGGRPKSATETGSATEKAKEGAADKANYTPLETPRKSYQRTDEQKDEIVRLGQTEGLDAEDTKQVLDWIMDTQYKATNDPAWKKLTEYAAENIIYGWKVHYFGYKDYVKEMIKQGSGKKT